MEKWMNFGRIVMHSCCTWPSGMPQGKEEMKVALISDTLLGTNLQEKDIFPGG